MRDWRTARLLLAAVLFLTTTVTVRAAGEKGQQGITVRDVVEFTKIADPLPGHNLSFSPDGKLFYTLTQTASVDKNVVRYDLAVYDAVALTRTLSAASTETPAPLRSIHFDSSSNRRAISQIKWVSDSELAFLAETPKALPQVYSFDVGSGDLRQLTSAEELIVAFGVRDRIVVYATRSDPTLEQLEQERAHGIWVDDQTPMEIGYPELHKLSDLARVKIYRLDPNKDERPAFLFETKRPFIVPFFGFWISPSGSQAIALLPVDDIPSAWTSYTFPFFSAFASGPRVGQFFLLDLDRGTRTPIFNAPSGITVGFGAPEEAFWIKRGSSVIITNTMLPLDARLPGGKRAASTAAAVEYDVARRRTRIITTFDPLQRDGSGDVVRDVAWDEASGQLRLRRGSVSRLTDVAYQRSAGWRERPLLSSPPNRPISITIEESADTPPDFYAILITSGRRVRLTRLNPQFDFQRLAKVEQFSWRDPHGRTWQGHLYLPFGYTAGKRYPLVIQTHGYNANRFELDGPHPTAFAAQPLAARGLIVLQMGEAGEFIGTTDDGPRHMAAYESAIDALAGRGMVDTARVGIVGFSATSYYIKYSITHSRSHYAAATIADGIDMSYLQYLLVGTSRPSFVENYDKTNGSRPFGKGFERWSREAPGFRVGEVRTPLLIQAIGRGSPTLEWEFFAGLKLQNKPVEMLALIDGSHTLVRPNDRMASLGANVDWMSFWLAGYEDPNPAKAGQYERWRRMRAAQKQQGTSFAASPKQ